MVPTVTQLRCCQILAATHINPLGFEGVRQLGEYIVKPIRHTMCAELASMIKIAIPQVTIQVDDC